ncbi:RNA-binding protein 25 [Trichonephila inaurata madagascariensis]|uniref:RNA-binding protein 25 n=1 Tax=Trichonephila inaurata madagascariensis TaxID=2747483 RepID=A0A8X7CKZ8_9ARAC|nr:RNA-binding protein 25 [Trichonephila inaurata madagascariensis]
MSFPPGPPLPIPGIGPMPPMMPPPYAVPPMGGMIPMTVGMMPGPMMTPVAMTMPTPISMHQHHQLKMKKLNTHTTFKKQDNNLEHQESPKGPPVTVFVGNITDRAPDNLVRQILQRCGIVLNWKRVQGANGKLQAFGFCEYGDPESALRAMRLLHDYEIGDKKLVVKVDGKTKEKLDEYKANKLSKAQEEDEKDKEEKDSNKEEGEASDDALDEHTKQRDNAILGSLQHLIKAHSSELTRPPDDKDIPAPAASTHQSEKSQNSENNSPKPRIDYERLKKNELDEMDLEEDKKSLIHREIDKFRDTYKRAEEERDKDKSHRQRRRDYESPESRTRDRERERERDRDKRWSKERSSGREERTSRRRRSRERKHDSPRESPVVSRSHRERSRERQQTDRSGTRDVNDWNREREPTEEKPKEKDFEKEDDDDVYEKKKHERKAKEKESIYQERLKNWMARERRKAKEYEKERIRAEEQKKDEAKEARRLKEFLEDYDDEKDDPKYFKGNSLVRRMKEREKEIEEDILDRQKEKEELDELRKKLVEEGHPDPEAEVERLLLEESRLMEPPKPESPESEPEPEIHHSPVKIRTVNKPISSPLPIEEKIERISSKRVVSEEEISQNSFSGFSDVITQPEEVKLMGFTSLRLGSSPTQQHNSSPSVPAQSNHTSHKRKVTVDDVFNVNDEETDSKKKRKLIPIDDNHDDGPKSPNSVLQMTIEEKRKHIKSLIEKIPTEKNELFAFNLDWAVVDKVLMEKRIRPWINKKIVEYIGEEEPTLVEFICSKIMAGSAAQSILDDVSMVLDEEAEVFVVKMWRLLIYEIEAKKLGLVCKPDSGLQENVAQGKT